MRKQPVLAPKRRPPGPGVQVVVRLQPDHLSGLDAWIAKQPDPLTRPEALRAMLVAELKTTRQFPLPQKTEKHSQDEQTGKRAK
jgi:hypothetical protein